MKIVVLMGGDSSERDVSLVSGDQVAKALTENGHEVIKIDPAATKAEQTELNQTDKHWIGIDYPDTAILPLHRGSLYTKNILIIKRLQVDAVFNALHGGKGENGIVQGIYRFRTYCKHDCDGKRFNKVFLPGQPVARSRWYCIY